MVTVRELARSQGFPDSFVFESINGNVVTVSKIFKVHCSQAIYLLLDAPPDWKRRPYSAWVCARSGAADFPSSTLVKES